MIEAILYGALGFFLAGLIAVLFVPALWNRAARITRRQLEDTLPRTSAEIKADKDRLRAEFATELRQLETELEKAKAKAVRELVETSKRQVRIGELEGELSELREKLEETESAKQALEHTLRRGLPRMEQELEQAREAMAEMQEIESELHHRYNRDKEALRLAQKTVKRQSEEIGRLRAVLEAGEAPIRRLFGPSDSALAQENRRLLARLSVLEEEFAMARHIDSENYLLRQEMRNLSMQILRAAQGEEAPLPALLPEEPPEGLEDYRRASDAFAQSAASERRGEEPGETAETTRPVHPKPAPEPPAGEPKRGFRSRLKERLRGQSGPASARSKSLSGSADQSDARPQEASAPLSERFAARRSRAAGRVASGQETPETVGGGRG